MSILIFASMAAAVPADPTPFELIQADGSIIHARQVGDEREAHFETEDGFSIVKSGDSWEYALSDNNGKLISSGNKVGSVNPKKMGLTKHLHPIVSSIESLETGVTGSIISDEIVDPALSRKISGYVSDLAAQIGTKKILVILINFTDLNSAAASTPSYYQNLIFNSTPGANSMNNYYKEVSYNQMDVTGVVAGNRWFRTSNNLAWYGADVTDIDTDTTKTNPNDRYIFKLAKEAVIAADPYVDYSQYDTDGDGVIDHILIVHAGNGQESSGVANDIWSHRWFIQNWNGSAWNLGIMTNDGVKAVGYTMLAEKSPVGTFAHEFGHDIGLPDLYNTDTGAWVVGQWDLMDGGSWNNNGNTPSHPSAWDKIKLGWMNPTKVTLNSTKNVLQLENNGQAYQVNNSAMAANEYFLIENREMTGYDAALPEAGLLIWHVDENRLNNNGAIKMLVPQDASNGAVAELRGAAYSTNDGQTALTPSSAPNTNSNAGGQTGISFFDIGYEGQSMPVTITMPGGGDGDKPPCLNPTLINFDNLNNLESIGSHYQGVVFSPGYTAWDSTGNTAFPQYSKPNVAYTHELINNITFNNTASYVQGYFTISGYTLTIAAYDAGNNLLSIKNITNVQNQLVTFNYPSIKKIVVTGSGSWNNWWTLDDLSYCGKASPCDGKILFDEGHNNLWKTTQGYTNLAKELRLAGYSIDVLNTTVTMPTLSQYNLFIANAPVNGYTEAEIAAIQSYVYNGGSVFLIGEFSGGWGTPALNTIARPFGIQANYDMVNHPKNYRNNTFWPIISNVISPLSGVKSYIEYAGASLYVTKPAWAIAWSDNESYVLRSPPASSSIESSSVGLTGIPKRVLQPVTSELGETSPVPDTIASGVSTLMGSNIAVLTTVGVDNSVRKALNESGYAYDYYFLGAYPNFGSVNFAPYDTIIVALSGGLVDEANVSILRNQLDLGKKVILLGGTNYDPFVNGINMYLLGINTTNHVWSIPVQPHVKITDTSSQLITGLPSVINFTDSQAAYYNVRVTDTGIDNAAVNGDGYKILFNKKFVGDLIWFINSPQDPFWNNNTDYQYFKQILINALNFQSNRAMPMIAISRPQGGRAAYIADSDIFDDMDWEGNSITSLYELNNKQVLLSLVQWLAPTCGGVPDILVKPTMFNESLLPGASTTELLAISNVGTATLNYSITDNAAWLSESPISGSILPGGVYNITLTFVAPTTPGVYSAAITIASNDPDENPVTVPVVMYVRQVSGPVVYVNPAYLGGVSVGSNFTVDIVVDPRGAEVYAAEYKLYFDVSKLEALNQITGPFLTQDGNASLVFVNKFNNTIGVIEYGQSRTETLTGVKTAGVLATIKFGVKTSAAAGNTTLNLSDVLLSDPSPAQISGVTEKDGIVNIILNKPPVADCGPDKLKCENVKSPVQFNGSASKDVDGLIVSYDWNFGDGFTGTGVMPTHIYNTSRWNGTAYLPFTAALKVTDDKGASSTDTQLVTIWIAGDANGDGVVNIIDAASVGLKWGSTDPCADLNNDGKVNIMDASIIGLNWGKKPVITG